MIISYESDYVSISPYHPRPRGVKKFTNWPNVVSVRFGRARISLVGSETAVTGEHRIRARPALCPLHGNNNSQLVTRPCLLTCCSGISQQ